MQEIHAKVGIVADFDHGEGWLHFGWEDAIGCAASLTIDMDGHCSREMPIRSGLGPPQFLGLQRDRIRLGFTAELAAKLEMEQVVEFQFVLDDATFDQLRQFDELWPQSPGDACG